MKTIELKQVGYLIEGESKLLLWGNDEGHVNFTPFKIMKDDLKTEDIIIAIDDGEFGCQRLIEAYVNVYELYENNYVGNKILERHFNIKTLNKYNYINNNKYIKEKYGERYPNKLDFIKYRG